VFALTRFTKSLPKEASIFKRLEPRTQYAQHGVNVFWPSLGDERARNWNVGNEDANALACPWPKRRDYTLHKLVAPVISNDDAARQKQKPLMDFRRWRNAVYGPYLTSSVVGRAKQSNVYAPIVLSLFGKIILEFPPAPRNKELVVKVAHQRLHALYPIQSTPWPRVSFYAKKPITLYVGNPQYRPL